MMDLPEGWPKFCRDLKQLSVDLGSPKHPPDPEGEHDALIDARWNRDLYNFLDNVRPIYRAEKGREMMAQLEKVEKKYAR